MTACGDQGPTDLAPGTGSVTVTGAIQSTDAVRAVLDPIGETIYGADTAFSVDIFLIPTNTTTSLVSNTRVGTFSISSYSIFLEVSGSGAPRPGTYQIGSSTDPITDSLSIIGSFGTTSGEIMDSIGIASLANAISLDSTKPAQPLALLDAKSGHITIDRIDANGFAGSFVLNAASESGRTATATGTFYAKALSLTGSISPPFLSPSRARQ